MNHKHYETKKGARLINKMFEDLTSQARKVVGDIEYAKSFGDLSENAEYKEAKNMQRHISAALSELMDYKRGLIVVESNKASRHLVSICATVHLLNLETDEKKVYKIVGEKESDASKGLLFYNSPLAKSLMGRKIGEDVEFKSPESDKVFYYQIENIGYDDDEEEEEFENLQVTKQSI